MGKYYPTGPIEDLMRQMLNLQRFKKEKKDHFEELTEREIEILSLVAGGLKTSVVAQELGISPATVQNHRAQIRDKLNIQSQADFIKYAMAYELVQF